MEDLQDEDRAAALLQKATEAAARGDPIEMIEAVMGSGFLAGVVRRLQRQWPRLPPSEVDECVASAMDSAFSAVSGGRIIRNLGGWLWKAALNGAQDRWADYSRRAPGANEIADVAAPEYEDEDTRLEREFLTDFRRSEAIRLARELLPRIGEGQVVDVMELVIDAAVQGIEDLPASEIAEALDLSEGSARKLISRGLQRLRREAERVGIKMPDSLPDTYSDN